MLRRGLKTMWSLILDCVFPQSCLRCGEADVFVCTNCRNNSALVATPQKIMVETKSPPLIEVQSLVYYQPDSLVAQLIESLKYHYSTEARQEIVQWLKHNQSVLSIVQEIDLIIPISLHARRQAERGFNQAEYIARALGKLFNKPVVTQALVRVRATKQQAKLGRAERLTNIHKAFTCIQSQALVHKSILLVDDVYTTGSTMQAAAEALERVGVKKIRGLVLACGLANK